MLHCSRRVATCLIALLLLAQLGCATTSGTAASGAATTQQSTDAAGSGPAGQPGPEAALASPPNFVELGAAGSATWAEDDIPRYSNTYVYETLDYPGIVPFATADYYNGGGYPIYYPYPYTIGSKHYDDHWYSAYGSTSRRFRSAGGAGSGATAVSAKAGRDAAVQKTRLRGKARNSGARTANGRVHPAAAASAQRQAASGQRPAGAGSTETDERQPSAEYLAARARSGYRSGATNSRPYYRHRNGSGRAWARGATRAYPSSHRPRSGAPATIRRR